MTCWQGGEDALAGELARASGRLEGQGGDVAAHGRRDAAQRRDARRGRDRPAHCSSARLGARSRRGTCRRRPGRAPGWRARAPCRTRADPPLPPLVPVGNALPREDAALLVHEMKAPLRGLGMDRRPHRPRVARADKVDLLEHVQEHQQRCPRPCHQTRPTTRRAAARSRSRRARGRRRSASQCWATFSMSPTRGSRSSSRARSRRGSRMAGGRARSAVSTSPPVAHGGCYTTVLHFSHGVQVSAPRSGARPRARTGTSADSAAPEQPGDAIGGCPRAGARVARGQIGPLAGRPGG